MSRNVQARGLFLHVVIIRALRGVPVAVALRGEPRAARRIAQRPRGLGRRSLFRVVARINLRRRLELDKPRLVRGVVEDRADARVPRLRECQVIKGVARRSRRPHVTARVDSRMRRLSSGRPTPSSPGSRPSSYAPARRASPPRPSAGAWPSPTRSRGPCRWTSRSPKRRRGERKREKE